MKSKKWTVILAVLSVILLIIGIQTQYYFDINDYADKPRNQVLKEEALTYIRKDAYQIMNAILSKDDVVLSTFNAEHTNLRYKLLDYHGYVVASNIENTITLNTDSVWSQYISFTVYDYGYGYHISTYVDKILNNDKDAYVFYAYIDSKYEVNDIYSRVIYKLDQAYALHEVYTYVIFPLLTIELAFAIYQLIQYCQRSEVKERIRIYYKKVKESMIHLYRRLSFMKKAAYIVSGIVLLEALMLVFTWNKMNIYLIIWCIEKLILLPIIFVFIENLKKIKLAAEELASGNLEYKISTEHMLSEFKKHGENMNNIADVLNVAIENRLQSERMKTELISNVSHDIKTPLTSIINYAGLIEKEECNSPKHKEYAEVLVRKARHLKRLLEDLIEASKAYTGNMEIKLEACEANVLLTQAVGEFEQRLQEYKLELITKAPEEPIMILVDSKRIWRIFENLLMNACKYSLEGSRVYLHLDKVGNEAVFSFRNTSRDLITTSAAELMERFVRGDSARSTEGHGLGLSIAKSLTELQNGKIDIIIDGDLFKVILKFPLIS